MIATTLYALKVAYCIAEVLFLAFKAAVAIYVLFIKPTKTITQKDETPQ